MPFKNTDLVAFCEDMVGQPYWYGTCVYPCTQSRLDSKAKQYPTHYTASRMPTYKKHIANRLIGMDCIGMIKGFFWTDGGVGVREYLAGGKEFANHYASNGCPDQSANGMASWLKKKKVPYGVIGTLPDIPGVLVFKDGHVGVYVGNGYAVEAMGFKYGVVKTKIKDRPWTHWAMLPDTMMTYNLGDEKPTMETVKDEPVKASTLGKRLLKRTSPMQTGEDVAELQARLNELGFDCGEVDGEFGKNTEKGVKAFQTAAQIEVDGEFGKNSLAALNNW